MANKSRKTRRPDRAEPQPSDPIEPTEHAAAPQAEAHADPDLTAPTDPDPDPQAERNEILAEVQTVDEPIHLPAQAAQEQLPIPARADNPRDPQHPQPTAPRTHPGRVRWSVLLADRSRALRRTLTTPRAKRTVMATGFIAFILACSSVLIVSALTRAEPSWWGVVDPDDPKTRQLAEQLENGVTTLLSDPRPPNKSRDPRDPWTVRLNAADANAWLNARLRQWLDTQDDIGFKWPEQVQELRVRFDDGRIYVGARVDQNGASQIFTAALRPRFEADGALWLPAERIALGRFGLPATWVLPTRADDSPASNVSPVVDRVGEVSEEIAELPQTRQVLRALAGANAVLSNPIVKLPDGRRVRLLGLRAQGGGLLITCQTIVRDGARADGRSPAEPSPAIGAPPPARTGHTP
ncbi:MAG: hypothetical protein KF768_04215 [Phycisphaeraceae bacterium]|nr:hypothetical protein [Phycisphaeraceae bacterium]